MIKRGGIGDWIIFAPALEQFRSALQGHAVDITVYTEKLQSGIAAMIGLFDRVILFDQATRKGLFARHRLLAGLRREQFDLWIDADISRTNVGDAMSLASAAKVRVGYAANADSPCHAMIENRAFTHTLKDNLGQVHMSERFERLLAFSATLAIPESGIHSGGDAPRSGLRNFCWVGAQADYFVVAPGASSPIRMWPATRFAELAKLIAAQYRLRPVLVGTQGDEAACSEIARLLDQPDLINRAGKDSIADLFKLIAGARLLLTNDSGPMHIGKATETPTLAIVSGADFTSYASYPKVSANFSVAHSQDQSCFNCRWNCIYPSTGKNAIKPCLDAVTVAAARGLADQLINQTTPSNQQ